jgi:acetyl esterase/lipase
MRTYLLLLSLICLVYAQDIRFIDEIFDEVSVTEDIVYGNAPDLPFLFITENNTVDIDLHMDVYQPVGDTMNDRPVIIFAHSGAFFSGNKEVDDIVLLSQEAARRGYVAIAMEYRLGLNILSASSGERAVYRGIQDASALIRYLREFHDELNIDPNHIFFWGSSAGSFIGLHLSYIEDSERPESTFEGTFSPDLGCIDCEGNDYSHSNKPNALIATWGAIGNLDYIDEYENVPTALFHGTLDIVVPYDEGYPFTLNITLPQVYGSSKISEKMTDLGINHLLTIEQNQPHEYYGATNGNFLFGSDPNEYWDLILNSAFNFLYTQLSVQGDVNSDGSINIQDIVIVLNYIFGSDIPTAEQFNASDMNNDGILNVLDVILIVEKITS